MALTLEHARQCLARGLAAAHRLGFRVAIAVVDEAGHLVTCDRMDGALWVTPEIARAKANAAAAFRTTTLDLEERFTKRMLFADNVATLGTSQFVFGKGGVPIVEDGHVVGAVGVSGAIPAEHDHDIADAAAGHPEISRTH
jgi:glc operon protein GlcG